MDCNKVEQLTVGSTSIWQIEELIEGQIEKLKGQLL